MHRTHRPGRRASGSRPMSRTRTLFLLLVAGATLTAPSPSPRPLVVGTRDVVTTLARGTVWGADAVVSLRGTVEVAASDTLRIQPGARVEVESGGSLVVRRGAALIAEGAPTLPIV